MQCHRRGRETAVEGAFLAVSLLSDAAWEATEQLDFERVEQEDLQTPLGVAGRPLPV